MFDEQGKQAEFSGAEGDDHALRIDELARQHVQRPAGKGGIFRNRPMYYARRPAEQSLDPGKKFPCFKGFGKVIVPADFEADDAVHAFSQGAEEKDGDIGPGAVVFPQAAADAQTVFTGKHDIEDDEFERWGLAERKKTFACGKTAYGEAVVGKALAEETGEFGVVVDDADMRGAGHGKSISANVWQG